MVGDNKGQYGMNKGLGELSRQYQGRAGRQAGAAGLGVFNRLTRGLPARSAGIFGAAGAAGRAQGDAYTSAMLPFEKLRIGMVEGGRQFDISTALKRKALRQQMKMAQMQQFGAADIFGGIAGAGVGMATGRIFG